MTDQPLLSVEDLSVAFKTKYGSAAAVNHISFSLAKGEKLGLVGESGSGKSVTSKSIIRLLASPPAQITGSIRLNGEELLTKSERQMCEIRGNKISMIFQDPMTALNPVMRVGDQIVETISLHMECSRAEAVERSLDMLKMVGIGPERSTDYPHQLSGGMKQRVVIAMALACSPALLIADEPTTALDVTIQAQVLKLMKELKKKYNMAMLMITHDLGIVADVCDEVSVMYAGRVVEHGTLFDVFEHTAHPYTEGLFQSIPNIKARTERLKPIRGLMPDPTDIPPGCPFAPRCNYATEQCAKAMPERTDLSDTHYVYCIRYGKEA